MRISLVVGALALSALCSGTALAYDSNPPPAAPAMTPSAEPEMDAAARAAKSDECYKRADAQGLHFKERKDFHRECMKRP
jgi:hypothetical protein